MPFLGRASLFILLMALFACKPNNSAQLQTLENLAGGDVRPNECMADPFGRISNANHFAATDFVDASTVDRGIMAAALEASKALPADIRQKFREMGGKIRVTPQASNACAALMRGTAVGKLLNKDLPSHLDSCAVLLEATSTSKQTFEVILPAQADRISHQLVRQFGLVASQIFARLSQESPNGSTVNRYLEIRSSPEMVASKIRLASSYLIDLHRSHLFDFNGASAFLSRELLNRVSETIVSEQWRTAPWQAFDGILPAEISAEDIDAGKYNEILSFSDHVFAEAFDSFYCRRNGKYDEASMRLLLDGKTDRQTGAKILRDQKNTYLIMYDLFPQTWNSFQALDRIINPGGGRPVVNRAPLPMKSSAPREAFSLQSGGYSNRGGYGGGWWNPGNWLRGLYTGDPNAPDNVYDAAAQAAGESVQGNIGRVHTALDVIGTVDPIGVADTLNAATYYAVDGDHRNASISMAGVIPFVGDAAKLGRVGKAGLKYADEVTSVGSTVLRQNDTIVDSANAGIRQAKRDVGIPMTQQPIKVESVPMTAHGRPVIDTTTNQPVMTKEYTYHVPGAQNDRVIIQNHSAGHAQFQGEPAALPHINARQGSGTGPTAPGARDHYVIKPPEKKS